MNMAKILISNHSSLCLKVISLACWLVIFLYVILLLDVKHVLQSTRNPEYILNTFYRNTSNLTHKSFNMDMIYNRFLIHLEVEIRDKM